MDEEEYFKLAESIQHHISKLGLDDIANSDNYADYEGDDRLPPDGKTPIKLMLAAFDRYLAANSSETIMGLGFAALVAAAIAQLFRG